MFVALGVLLSTIFTPIVSSTTIGGNVITPSTSFHYNTYYERSGTMPNYTYTAVTDDYTQDFDFQFENLDAYLLSYADYWEVGSHEHLLFTISCDENGITFGQYFSLYVSFDTISVNSGYSRKTRNYGFTFSICDYDYPNVPTFNYYIEYFITYTSDQVTNAILNFGNYDYVPLYYREIVDYAYVPTGNIYPFKFTIRFHWLPQEVYNNAINGYDTDAGYKNGFSAGKEVGYTEGYQQGLDVGYTPAYNNGYADGYTEGFSAGGNNTYTFGKLFGAIADVPIMILRNLLGFEVFGVEAISILMSMITGCIAIFLIRKFI